MKNTSEITYQTSEKNEFALASHVDLTGKQVLKLFSFTCFADWKNLFSNPWLQCFKVIAPYY